jgi:hypothetical protein
LLFAVVKGGSPYGCTDGKFTQYHSLGNSTSATYLIPQTAKRLQSGCMQYEEIKKSQTSFSTTNFSEMNRSKPLLVQALAFLRIQLSWEIETGPRGGRGDGASSTSVTHHPHSSSLILRGRTALLRPTTYFSSSQTAHATYSVYWISLGLAFPLCFNVFSRFSKQQLHRPWPVHPQSRVQDNKGPERGALTASRSWPIARKYNLRDYLSMENIQLTWPLQDSRLFSRAFRNACFSTENSWYCIGPPGIGTKPVKSSRLSNCLTIVKGFDCSWRTKLCNQRIYFSSAKRN